MLVLEQSRVEVAVLLNELAQLKDEASKRSSAPAETIVSKKRDVAIAFSLLEKIISLISNASENEGMSYLPDLHAWEFCQYLKFLRKTIVIFSLFCYRILNYEAWECV